MDCSQQTQSCPTFLSIFDMKDLQSLSTIQRTQFTGINQNMPGLVVGVRVITKKLP